MADRPRIVLVAAVSENGVIGRDGDMPWHLPDDLKRFKRITMGHPVLMGRRTWESIGKALPGRRNIVLTRDRDFVAEGAVVVHTIDEACSAAASADLFVIGGGVVYRLLLDDASVVELTRVHADVEGDTTFPSLPSKEWSRIHQEDHAADERHIHAFTFERWERAEQLH